MSRRVRRDVAQDVRELERNAKKKSKYMDASEFCLQQNNPALAEYEPTMAWERDGVTSSERGVDPSIRKCGPNARNFKLKEAW